MRWNTFNRNCWTLGGMDDLGREAEPWELIKFYFPRGSLLYITQGP